MTYEITIKRGSTVTIPVEVFVDTDSQLVGTETVRAVIKLSRRGVIPSDTSPDAAVLSTEWTSSLGTGFGKGWLCTLSAEQTAALVTTRIDGTARYFFDFRIQMGAVVLYTPTLSIKVVERVTEAS